MMPVAWTLVFCLLTAKTIADSPDVGAGKEVYVAANGKDYLGCGTIDVPCKTIRYAVTLTEPFSKVLIDGSQGPYTNETNGSYITIDHSLRLTAWNQHKVVIQCRTNSSKLFQVITPRSQAEEDTALTCLTLSNVVIQNCHSTGFPATEVISLVNAQLKLNNSEFFGNGLLVHHPQISVNESCERIEVLIQNCKFMSNFVARPFQYGLSLFGCRNISLIIEDSHFQSTPIAVRSTNRINIKFVRVAFDGRNIKASGVRITLSPGDNSISFSKCNITGHLASKSSAVAIFAESVPQGVSTVTFSDTRFLQNQRQSTSGGALSIISRFFRSELDVRIDRCIFEGNSASDAGGAVYIAYSSLVHVSWSRFHDNEGANGGAIYLLETSNVSIANSLFENNSAVTKMHHNVMTKGGAIFADKSEFQITYSNFTSNSASYTGSALFAKDCSQVSITSSRFENTKIANDTSPQNQLVHISTVDKSSAYPTVSLVKSSFMVHGVHDQNVLFINGQISAKNNTLACPEGHNPDRSILPPDYLPKYFDYLQLGVWCETCPLGKYRLSSNSEDLLCSEFDSSDTVKKSSSLCRLCPPNAACEYGRIAAHPNYWGKEIDNGLVEMFLCPRGYCCDCSDSCTGYQSCREDRNGTLCSDCVDGYEKSLQLGYSECTSSESCWSRGITAGFIAGFFLFFFLILILKYHLLKMWWDPPVKDTEDRETLLSDDGGIISHVELADVVLVSASTPSLEDGTTSSLPVFLVVVVFFYQLVPVVYPRISVSKGTLDAVLKSIAELFSFLPPFSLVSICPGKLIPISSSAAQFLIPSLFYWTLLFLLGISFLLSAATTFLVSSGPDRHQRLKGISTQFGTGLVFFLLYSFVPLMKVSLQAVTCIHIHNAYFVIGDSTTSCYQTWQVFVVLYFVFCVVPLFFVLEKGAHLLRTSAISKKTFVLFCIFPFTGVIMIVWVSLTSGRVRKPRETEPDSSPDVDLLEPHDECLDYALPMTLYREFSCLRMKYNALTILLLRSVLLVVFGTLLTQWPFVQSLLLALVCLLFLVHHLSVKWFASVCLNRLECLHLVLLTVLSFMNVYASALHAIGQGDARVATEVVLRICDWSYRVVLFCVAFWAAFFLYHAVRRCCRHRRS